MAKKNSTKTATKEALQASEPRVQMFSKWGGISIQEAPYAWEASDGESNQTDLQSNLLMVQNNVITVDSGALETRNETEILVEAPSGLKFTGVASLIRDCIYAAFDDGSIKYHQLHIGHNTWQNVAYTRPSEDPATIPHWTSINYFLGKLVCLAYDPSTTVGEIFTGALYDDSISAARYIPNPKAPSGSSTPDMYKPVITLTKDGQELTIEDEYDEDHPHRLQFCYTYCNKFGQTLASDWKTVWASTSPVTWSAVTGGLRISQTTYAVEDYEITGVDIYMTKDDSQTMVLIGHTEIDSTSGHSINYDWFYDWYGAEADLSEWSNSPLFLPTVNTTKGVDAEYMNCHDGRCYFFGGSKKYRLYIGGDIGNELSVSTGTGGGYVDIEPGSDIQVMNTHKFKTYNGANIVTIMCGHPNSSLVRRYNLIETNTSFTNEMSFHAWKTEEVSNVVGCNSHWGSGVWADGLYTLSRNGLAITTQAMENSNNLRAQIVSANISPIFTDRLNKLLGNSRMIFNNDVIYFALSCDDSYKNCAGLPYDQEAQYYVKDTVGYEPVTIASQAEYYAYPPSSLYIYVGESVDHVIFCYDINKKAWYTFTHDEPSVRILHLLNIDHKDFKEGIGIVTEEKISLIPLVGVESNVPRYSGDELDISFDTYIETGELSIRTPSSQFYTLSQLEFRFDYFIGDIDIDVEGVDYYGRKFHIHKDVTYEELQRNLAVYMRIDYLVDTYNLKITGKTHFRLTHILGKVYTASNKVNLVYGFDDSSQYRNLHGGNKFTHHYISDYNNLRKTLVP